MSAIQELMDSYRKQNHDGVGIGAALLYDEALAELAAKDRELESLREENKDWLEKFGDHLNEYNQLTNWMLSEKLNAYKIPSPDGYSANGRLDLALNELESLRAEREQLKQAAVLAMRAVEEVAFETLKAHMQELDSYLANGLSDKLWEEINAAALERVKGTK